MHRASGFPLNGLMDNATSHAINQEDPDKAALQVCVCALRHHSQQVRVQVLQECRKNALIQVESTHFVFVSI